MSPFWTAFWIVFIYIPLVAMWLFGLTDVFRRADLSGLAKVLWVLAIIWLPIIGLVAYFITRPDDVEVMFGFEGEDLGTSVAEELEILSDLHDRGKLTDEEFEEEKRRVLAP